jgi:hypothetical protein
MRLKLITLTVMLLCACDAEAAKRALLIGINDYSATHIGRNDKLPQRDWPTLRGAVNDVQYLQQMLPLYGFASKDIVVLTDQNATRNAITSAIDNHLTKPVRKDDVVFFYFAGHGSQVRNSSSDEPDRLDESIVPADSRAGARDITDKELRSVFNRILDRGARLTIMLDHCHSGSGARGLASGAHSRGIRPDPRDLAQRTAAGPRLEDRALVVMSTQDYDTAWEMADTDGQWHGAFTWAWIRAMRDAASGLSATDIFLRAQALMRGEIAYQAPVLAGSGTMRSSEFLGGRMEKRDRTVVAVQKVRDGVALLQGGWTHGLAPGSELRAVGGDARVVITAMHGLAQSEGRIAGTALRPGALMEVVRWAVPPGRPLRVWLPRIGDVDVRQLRAEARRRNLQWIADPTETTPSYVLRPGLRQWELVGIAAASDPLALLKRIPKGASIFVQLPAPPLPLEQGIVLATSAETADYILAGRYHPGKISYAWVRPHARATDKTTLPARSAWTTQPGKLAEAARALRRIHGWMHLQSPPTTAFPYRLAVRRDRDGAIVTNGKLAKGERYSIVLRASSRPSELPPRFVYIFIIDRNGESFLLYPRAGSVENRFPPPSLPTTIPLGEASAFEITPPLGADTYFLLTTDEPLPNPWILEWDGVRAPRFASLSAWSVEKVVFESVQIR